MKGLWDITCKSTVKNATRIPTLHHCRAENRKAQCVMGRIQKNGDVQLAREKAE